MKYQTHTANESASISVISNVVIAYDSVIVSIYIVNVMQYGNSKRI